MYSVLDFSVKLIYMIVFCVALCRHVTIYYWKGSHWQVPFVWSLVRTTKVPGKLTVMCGRSRPGCVISRTYYKSPGESYSKTAKNGPLSSDTSKKLQYFLWPKLLGNVFVPWLRDRQTDRHFFVIIFYSYTSVHNP